MRMQTDFAEPISKARPNQRAGVTLIELLVTLIVGSIVMLALAMPFVAERRFWTSGKRQTQSQRDAEVALRAMARVARQSAGVTITGGGSSVSFYRDRAKNSCAASFSLTGSQLFWKPNCTGSPPALVGAPSVVTTFSVSQASVNRVRVLIGVTQGSENELLDTDISLRNA